MFVDEFKVVLYEFCIIFIMKLIFMICIVMLFEILNKLYVIGINKSELLVILEVLYVDIVVIIFNKNVVGKLIVIFKVFIVVKVRILIVIVVLVILIVVLSGIDIE